MIALFRTTAAFFIVVLLLFIFVSVIVERSQQPSVTVEEVYSQYQTQLDTVRKQALAALEENQTGVLPIPGQQQMPAVLLYEISTREGPILRKEAPLLMSAQTWSMNPGTGGAPPYLSTAQFKLVQDGSEMILDAYVIPENIFDARGNPLQLTVYLKIEKR